MTSTHAEASGALSQLLVGPLRPDDRRRERLALLEQLPGRYRTVLVGCYLEGRTGDDVADSCGLTPRELAELRVDALRALGRLGLPRPAARRSAPTPYG